MQLFYAHSCSILAVLLLINGFLFYLAKKRFFKKHSETNWFGQNTKLKLAVIILSTELLVVIIIL